MRRFNELKGYLETHLLDKKGTKTDIADRDLSRHSGSVGETY